MLNRTYWWMEDWRNNPLIQRSRNPLLRELARGQIRYFVERGDSIEYMLRTHCGIMGGGIQRIEGGKATTATGHYLIPGSKTDNGVRCSSRQIGAMVEYDDGRVIWDVFDLAVIYDELKHGEKPRQLVMF